MVYKCQACGVKLDGGLVARQCVVVATCTDGQHKGPFAPILDSRGVPVIERRPEMQPEVRTAVEA